MRVFLQDKVYEIFSTTNARVVLVEPPVTTSKLFLGDELVYEGSAKNTQQIAKGIIENCMMDWKNFTLHSLIRN